jgi:hypothetical protein
LPAFGDRARNGAANDAAADNQNVRLVHEFRI